MSSNRKVEIACDVFVFWDAETTSISWMNERM